MTLPDIADLINKMTLEEKAALCTGASPWTTTPVEHLGIPGMMVSDGPHGVRHAADVNSIIDQALPATCFPTASCSASSWNVDLLYEMGQAIADECISMGIDCVLGPGANMKRTPLCGRNFEYFSEDPYLAGRMATSFINGVQSKGVGTSLKHFAGNNQEHRRLTINTKVDERSLREIYLPAFEMAVKEAKPWTVMCAYNRLNGDFCSENFRLLTEILKDEWGFDGFVVSDWGAVHDRVKSLKAGIDLEMPGPRLQRVNAVVQAARSGELDERVLDESVRRILNIVFKAAGRHRIEAFDSASHHALARRIASEGMVLLKNNGILPLKGGQNIAVIGRAAQNAHFQGGGSSHINPTQVDRPIDELRKLAGEAQLSYAEGYPEGDGFDQALIDEAVETARRGDVALLFIALAEESEGFDRTNLDLSSHQVALIKAVCAAQPSSVVILNNGAPVVMKDWSEGTAAVLEAWMMGQAGAGAVADILFGKVNPSGKLAETFARDLKDTPAYVNYPGENGEVRYGEGIFIGYRYYDYKDVPVEFPFGHGLSYTTFRYDNFKPSATRFKDVDGLSVSVDVTNTGEVTGSEVVQVYVHDCQSRLARPPKELKGFARVTLQPGETQTVSIELGFRAFAYYHPAYRQWITEDGEFDILVGASAGDIRGAQTVHLQSTLELPSLLSRSSTMRDWLEDPRGKRVLEGHLQQIKQQVRLSFGMPEGVDIGFDPTDFLIDMPLSDVFTFMSASQGQSPEDMVKELLAEVHATQ